MEEFGDSNIELPIGDEEPLEIVEAADRAILDGTTEDDTSLVEVQSRSQGAEMET
jgi:hypothetical protein